MNKLRKVEMIRYIKPLREGGSLPALAEGDDGYLYVLKFRGAGQGVKVLISELIGGELARFLGFKVPELVFAHLDVAYGRTEPDEEIQDLLKASTGLNLALHYLSGSYTFDPAVTQVDSELASQIVWLDSFLTNVDRTAKNTNLLSWNKEIWLIDHGASLYFQHSWNNWEEMAEKPFVAIKDHVLLKQASELEKVNQAFSEKIGNGNIFDDIVNLIPESWLENEVFMSFDTGKMPSPEEIKLVYSSFLKKRFQSREIFVKEAIHARERLI